MAYASVASLMRTMELLLTSNSSMQSLICDHREELLSLREKVGFLEGFLKNFEKSSTSRDQITDLEAQINEVANVAEYTIQLRITEAVMANDELQKEKAHERLCGSLKQVAEDIDRVHKESTKIQYKDKQASKKSSVEDSSSEKVIQNVNSSMTGRNDESERMLSELIGGSHGELKVIPVVGMGGIGKTTLAKYVYDDERIRSHFDVSAWATISKHHNVNNILVNLLRSAKGKNDTDYMDLDEAEQADMLQKSLKSRRFLIVLDDMWSGEAWDAVRLCFPSQNNGSRILLTTRNTEVACSAGTKNLSLQMDLMGPVESWNLFKSVAFANEASPSEFETIGKQIVDKCHGLPLTIVVVAGLLSKSKRTVEDWENVAKDVKSFVTNDPDKQCLHVLGLSYNHLTSDLKSCLLYFGVFAEDEEISAKRMVRLWSAEGFLKLEKDLEGEAAKCLQDLIDRCLVLVSKKNMNDTKVKSCKVHDLIYELCLREAQRENIFIMKDIVFNDSDAEKAQSHDIISDDEPNPVPPECYNLSSHKMQPFKQWSDGGDYGSYRALLSPGHHRLIRRQTDDDENNLVKRTRSVFSLYSIYAQTFTLDSELIHLNLLRVLDLSPIQFDIFPPQILSLIWLRYLVMSGDFDITPEIHRLWNLQTFIARGYRSESTFPEQIWELMQLRHLELERLYFPSPPILSVEGKVVLSNLQTIYGFSPRCCTKEVIYGIQNVKKLEIFGDEEHYEAVQESRLIDNIVHLHQLESLSIQRSLPWGLPDRISPVTIPSAKAFPETLKKLKLEGTGLRWEELNIIGELPNLEVLKLIYYACDGEEWYPSSGGFTRLKLLLIEECELKYWKATSDNFPVLERLAIRSCHELKEIPIEFAEINSLQLIELNDCTAKLEASATRIQQEQEDLGNKPVDVRIIQSYSGQYDSILQNQLPIAWHYSMKVTLLPQFHMAIII